MKTLTVEIPEGLEAEIKKYIESGWFKDESEIIRYSLREFIRKNKPEFAEKFMEEDIRWALNLKKERAGENNCL